MYEIQKAKSTKKNFQGYKCPHVDDVKMARGFQVYLPEGKRGRDLQTLSSGQI
jgi:hypothetical protein